MGVLDRWDKKNQQRADWENAHPDELGSLGDDLVNVFWRRQLPETFGGWLALVGVWGFLVGVVGIAASVAPLAIGGGAALAIVGAIAVFRLVR